MRSMVEGYQREGVTWRTGPSPSLRLVPLPVPGRIE
jgi:hypothetical protein